MYVYLVLFSMAEFQPFLLICKKNSVRPSIGFFMMCILFDNRSGTELIHRWNQTETVRMRAETAPDCRDRKWEGK